MEKKPIPAVAAGLIIGLVSVILFLVYYFTGQTFKKDAINYLPALIFLGLLIYFIVKWANDNANNVTFGKCFGYGFKIVAVASILVFVCSLIFILLVPDFKTQFIESIRQQMDQNQQLTDEQREQAVETIGKFFMISILGGGLFMNLLIGTIAALIGAAVAKKKPQTPFQQPQL